jgi:Cof subfamily protein (haloacid dehalogenase superfamily)
MKDIQNIRLIAADIDNTLLPAGHDDLSEYTYRVLNRALDRGYKLLICTGRHYTLMPRKMFDHLPMDRIGTINGACLCDREGRTIEKHPMSLEDMNTITKICIDNGIGLGFKFEDHIVTYANYDRFVANYTKKPEEAALIINDDEKRTHHLKYGLPLGTFIVGDESRIEPFVGTMDNLIFAWSHRNGYDVFLKDINKSIAVERVLKDEGWTWDNVIAFGDAGNDTPMIQKAAIGCALGNAKDDVQKYADLVCDTCLNDGVAKTLEELGIA